MHTEFNKSQTIPCAVRHLLFNKDLRNAVETAAWRPILRICKLTAKSKRHMQLLYLLTTLGVTLVGGAVEINFVSWLNESLQWVLWLL